MISLCISLFFLSSFLSFSSKERIHIPKPAVAGNMAFHHLFSFFFVFSLALSFSPLLQASGNEIPILSSPLPAALQLLQKKIGYEFHTIDLLRRAMTHPSYSGDNNKALKILGLSTIEATISLRFLSRDIDMSPKDLNCRILKMTGLDSCTEDAMRLGLANVVRVPLKTNSSSPAVVCGAFRAIFGAVAVDSGEVATAGNVFWRVHGHGAYGLSLF